MTGPHLLPRATLALLVLTTLIDFWWVYIDLSARFGLGSVDHAPFDTLAMSHSMSIWNDIAFYLHVPSMVFAIWLVARRSPWALAIYAFAMITMMLDWILLMGNEHYEETLFGYISFAMHAGVFLLLCVSFAQRQLR